MIFAMQEQNQNQIDKLISRLRRLNPTLTWKDIAQSVHQRYKVNLSINDIINRYEILIAKQPKQKLASIFAEFRKWEIDFQKIAQETGISTEAIKREILSVIANNIIKVCFIVRKRKISSLASNFLPNKKIKELLVLILNSENFPNIKREYSIFWNFVSRYYPDSHFLTVLDETYKSVYRELIILTQTFKMNDSQDETHSALTPDSFEKQIMNQSGSKNNSAMILEILELDRSRNKKTPNQTINLVSDEEMDVEEKDHANSLLGVELREEEGEEREETRRQELKTNILREAIRVHVKLKRLEKRLQEESGNEGLREQRLTRIVEMGCLSFLSMRVDSA